ncbi:polysaccharide pyruvyl transferase family protein [Antribacter sp. KLBMP9083]|uniref:Polysaccharide pyruvyl transferase family protein n=1 Tax=Antribacter soli TaxID=2910976 RepID=A0AA41U6A5_9MICO|nr:polysaccharide pyruvyl transferase family protein [Antribacter soli]MCF4120105.1 polysaccharide pyruvyl transferase family protein [Antribacter soli]
MKWTPRGESRPETLPEPAAGGVSRTIYLVTTAGHPNYGDEVIVRGWLRLLAEREPGAEVWVDCPNPGPAAALLHGEHPRVRFTDTLYRLCWEAPSDDPRDVGEFVTKTLEDPGAAPRWIAGIDIARSADVVHVVGGGYINSVWPRHVGLVAAAAWLRRERGVRLGATGLGLLPVERGVAEVWTESAAAFDVLTVRDEPSLVVARAGNPRARLAIDDVFVSGMADLLAGSANDAPDTMVCVQTDMYDGDFGLVVDYVREVARRWQGPWGSVGFVECMPQVDRAIYDALRDDFPEARFYSVWEILADGLPARRGQRWISTRFHTHLLAAAAGASGIALSLNNDYYAVSHAAVVAAGSGWTLGSLDDASSAKAGGAGELPARTEELTAAARSAGAELYGW